MTYTGSIVKPVLGVASKSILIIYRVVNKFTFLGAGLSKQIDIWHNKV